MKFCIALLAGAIMVATPAKAQHFKQLFEGFCGPRDTMVKTLKTRYAEVARAAGVVNSGDTATEIWANKETGSYSITSTKGKVTCIVFAGHSWTTFEPEIPGEAY